MIQNPCDTAAEAGRSVDALASILGGVPQAPTPMGPHYKVLCPLHNDTRPSVSLSVSVAKNGKHWIQAYCWVCGDAAWNDLRQALVVPYTRGSGGAGAGGADAWPEIDWRVMRRYDKADGSGTGDSLRYDNPEGAECQVMLRTGKGWRQCGRTAAHSHKISGHEGKRAKIPGGTTGFLVSVVNADADGAVVLCEGEKAADAVALTGMAAACSYGGAGAARRSVWTPLAERDVILWPDNDEPGWRYVNDAGRLIQAAGGRIAGVVMPADGAGKGDDAADLMDNAGGVDAVLAAIAGAVPYEVPPEPELTAPAAAGWNADDRLRGLIRDALSRHAPPDPSDDNWIKVASAAVNAGLELDEVNAWLSGGAGAAADVNDGNLRLDEGDAWTSMPPPYVLTWAKWHGWRSPRKRAGARMDFPNLTNGPAAPAPADERAGRTPCAGGCGKMITELMGRNRQGRCRQCNQKAMRSAAPAPAQTPAEPEPAVIAPPPVQAEPEPADGFDADRCPACADADCAGCEINCVDCGNADCVGGCGGVAPAPQPAVIAPAPAPVRAEPEPDNARPRPADWGCADCGERYAGMDDFYWDPAGRRPVCRGCWDALWKCGVCGDWVEAQQALAAPGGAICLVCHGKKAQAAGR